MHDYTDIRYHELRGDIIYTYEIDLDGFPTAEVMWTAKTESSTFWGQMSELFALIVRGQPSYSCECSWSFNNWAEVQYHMSLYCSHSEYEEDQDGNGRCLSCGSEVDIDDRS